ncbi:hypothetical protein C1O66_10630 [Paucibacter aquatile]|uniref:Erythromycin esterase n=1 Tax=Kinneretia aquatilis TaxID=2070761 RepID=A0A2N8KWU4_9BURK|nr:erythromycin esterase family protein [Paucibacter aquatile]PND37938.1 hypothetical protein C1O66_10630 [Paucibacter aquatile]
MNTLVMAHTVAPPVAPAQTFAYVVARTNRQGIARLRVGRLGGSLALSVVTARGFVHTPIDKTKRHFRLASCDAPLSYEVVEIGRTSTKTRSRPLNVVAARSFMDPPTQFAIPASQKHRYSVCLPPADYLVHRVESDRSVGPTELSTESQSGTTHLEIRHGRTHPNLPRGAGAIAGTPADMIEALATKTGASVLLGLGENSHGSANLINLLREAVEKEALGPIAVLALEIDAIAARHVDRALQSRDLPALRRAVATVPGWPYTSEEMLGLLESFARARQAPPRLLGLDVAVPFYACQHFKKSLEPDADQLAQLFARVQPLCLPLQAVDAGLNEVKAADARQALDSLMADTLVRRSPERLEELDHLRKFLALRTPLDALERDRFLALNLLRHEELLSAGTSLLLSHMGHVGFGEADSLGALLKKKLGDRYFAIGTLLGGGEVRAVHPASGPTSQRITGASSLEGTLEHAFTGLGHGDHAMQFAALSRISGGESWLTGRYLAQVIGAMYIPESGASQFAAISPREQFDALIYFDVSRATRPARGTP